MIATCFVHRHNELYYGTMWLARKPSGVAAPASTISNTPNAGANGTSTAGNATFHVVITGIGRASVMRTIRSLEGQLGPDDYLTIAFDGRDEQGVLPNVTELISGPKFNCTVNIQVG